jgi:hypothetical protein
MTMAVTVNINMTMAITMSTSTTLTMTMTMDATCKDTHTYTDTHTPATSLQSTRALKYCGRSPVAPTLCKSRVHCSSTDDMYESRAQSSPRR